MFRRILLGIAAFLAGSCALAVAAPKDDVSAAIDKLAASDNYSWSTTSANAGGGRGGFGGGAVEAKINKDGILSVSMAGRGGAAATEAFAKGDKVAVKGDAGWQSGAELTADAGGGGFNPAAFTVYRVQQLKAPAAQAKDLIGKLGDLTKTDDAYTADLTPDAAKDLVAFRFPGRGGPAGAAPPADAPAGPEYKDTKGSIKFWVKDGVLSKYEFHVTGSMSFNGNDQDIDRTTTTEIKDVGATKFEIPDEAKAKLQ
jgi:hypothetical protein